MNLEQERIHSANRRGISWSPIMMLHQINIDNFEQTHRSPSDRTRTKHTFAERTGRTARPRREQQAREQLLLSVITKLLEAVDVCPAR